jgi:hypothetical protein
LGVPLAQELSITAARNATNDIPIGVVICSSSRESSTVAPRLVFV